MLRLNAFSNKLTDLVNDFEDWMTENHIPNKMLWYADIFESEELNHLCTLRMSRDGNVVVSPAPKDSHINPFRRRRPLRYLLHLY